MDQAKTGRFISELRRKKSLTQEELGRRLGVSNKTVSRWENGNYMPDLSMLKPLSEVLCISLNELLSGEYISQENVAEKAEESIESTLEYSSQKIKKSKWKMYLIVAGTVLGLALIWLLLNAVFFAEVPHQSGDVSQWEERYPNHSAFEMGLSRTGQPVFVDTAKAMRQARVIYSDAIEYLQKEHHLLPLSQYTYKPYMV
ncbi:MAG: helix-turn-helix transcriptional regulator, partial [Oscillospiraceae bacterium]|nr:helix-turn-helix transcriptional regulator [Oscillospiraceae bacterium]